MTFVASFRARLIRSITSRYIRGMDLHKAEVNLVRRRMDVISRLARPARRVDIEETRVCDLKSEWLRPEGARAGKVLLYLHGGAYVLGFPNGASKAIKTGSSNSQFPLVSTSAVLELMISPSGVVISAVIALPGLPVPEISNVSPL